MSHRTYWAYLHVSKWNSLPKHSPLWNFEQDCAMIHAQHMHFASEKDVNIAVGLTWVKETFVLNNI